MMPVREAGFICAGEGAYRGRLGDVHEPVPMAIIYLPYLHFSGILDSWKPLRPYSKPFSTLQTWITPRSSLPTFDGRMARESVLGAGPRRSPIWRPRGFGSATAAMIAPSLA